MWNVELEHRIAIQISKLGSEECLFKVGERISISELEKVEIATVAGTHQCQRESDENGFFRRVAKLAPYRRETIRYTIKKHKDVVGV